MSEGSIAAGAVCRAPWTSLKLDPMGVVKICRYAEHYDIGQIRPGGPSLLSIWNGPEVQALRRAISEGDLSLGCSACAPVDGDASDVLAREYDEFTPTDPLWPVTMDLSLSSTCNLACITCNGNLSTRIRREREHLPPLVSPYDDEFFDQLAAFIPHVRSFTFHGGEPFLGRSTRRVWQMIRDAGTEPFVVVSTNGTRLNDDIEELVRALRMRITVSIDGLTAETNERIRTGVDHEALLRNIDRFAELSAEMGRSLRFNYCLVRENVHELVDFLCWAAGRGEEVRVIPVTDPARFDVALLPADELAEVVARLRDDGDRAAGRLGANRAAFAAALLRLEHALSTGRAEEADGVRVDVRPTELASHHGLAEALPDDDTDAVPDPAPPAHLAPATIPSDALVIDHRITIRAVRPARWATSLGAEGWVGRHASEIPGLLAAHYGTQPSIELVTLADGSEGHRLTFSSELHDEVLLATPVMPAGFEGEVTFCLVRLTPAG